MKEKLYDVKVIGTLLRMLDRYKDDAGEQHAAGIGLFGFLSIFPLLLLVIAAAAAFLADDVKADVVDAVLEAIPGIEAAFDSRDVLIERLNENAGSVGGIGAATLLFTGLKVVNSANIATLEILHVDVDVKGFMLRVRQLGVLVALGVLAILGVAASGLAGSAATIAENIVTNATDVLPGGDNAEGLIQLGFTVLGIAISVGADVFLFLMAYKLLSFGRGPSWRELWPGALLGGAAWTLLKTFGATYVARQAAGAPLNALASAVGLLALLYLAGRIYVYGLELNCILRRPGADLARRNEEVTYEGEDLDIIRLRASDPPLEVPLDMTGDGRADDVVVLPDAGDPSFVGRPDVPRGQRMASQRELHAYAFSGGRAGGTATSRQVDALELGRPSARTADETLEESTFVKQAASTAFTAAAWGALFRLLSRSGDGRA